MTPMYDSVRAKILDRPGRIGDDDPIIKFI
jgi:hypothetical protein